LAVGGRLVVGMVGVVGVAGGVLQHLAWYVCVSVCVVLVVAVKLSPCSTVAFVVRGGAWMFAMCAAVGCGALQSGICRAGVGGACAVVLVATCVVTCGCVCVCVCRGVVARGNIRWGGA
jgi:hypothetical protein